MERIASINLKLVAVFLLLILLTENIVFGLPGFYNQTANAVGQRPVCSVGGIYGGGILSSFKISLTCSDLSTFAESTGKDAISSDLVKIELRQANHIHTPYDAKIIGNELSLFFYSSYGSDVRNININSGAILSSDGIANDNISVVTENILDYAVPNIADDFYPANQGTPTNVSAALGVLSNDSDGETSVRNATVISGPINGSLTLNPDGSFMYMPSGSYSGSDSFVYSAMDQAGNLGTATVFMADTAPKIVKADFYKQGVGDKKYAKVGDVVRVDFETDEPVTVDNKIIAGHEASLYMIDSTHFYIYYVMQASDVEGVTGCSLIAHDSVGTIVSYSNNETGVIFDKTQPVINLNGPSLFELEIHSNYVENAKTNDATDGLIVNKITGHIDSNKVGTYILTYSAVDRAGNWADTVTRTVEVIDYISLDFTAISDELKLIGLNNNLDTVSIDNYINFSGLYVEKSINGAKLGRITFNNLINLSDDDTRNFLYELDSRMESGEVGVIGLNLSGAGVLSSIFGVNATLNFYNLDMIGYDKKSTLDDILSNIIAYDDNGHRIYDLKLDNKTARYIGCDNVRLNCSKFTINVSHFSKYTINKASRRDTGPASGSQNQLQPPNSTGSSLLKPLLAEEGVASGWGNQVALGARADVVDTTQKTTKRNNSTIIGNTSSSLTWYWWLLLIIPIGLVFWIFYAFIKRRNKNT